jgi:hypothetical protein
VLGTQDTFCIVIAGLLERDSFDLFLPEFDKPWVIHLRETCCCSTNLCTWRPNTVYKNRRVRRHQQPIEFNREDHPIIVPHTGKAPLVLKARIGGYDIDRVFMDANNGINLIYAKTLHAMHISLEFLKPIDCSFHGIIPGSTNYPLGRIVLDVCFGNHLKYR